MLAPLLVAMAAQASTDTVKSPPHPKKKYVEVLKLKSPDTTHGQILSPGQKPPATTFAESEKYAVPASTLTH